MLQLSLLTVVTDSHTYSIVKLRMLNTSHCVYIHTCDHETTAKYVCIVCCRSRGITWQDGIILVCQNLNCNQGVHCINCGQWAICTCTMHGNTTYILIRAVVKPYNYTCVYIRISYTCTYPRACLKLHANWPWPYNNNNTYLSVYKFNLDHAGYPFHVWLHSWVHTACPAPLAIHMHAL